MCCQYKITFEDGSTMTVVAGNPISAAEAIRRALTVRNAKIISTTPLK